MIIIITIIIMGGRGHLGEDGENLLGGRQVLGLLVPDLFCCFFLAGMLIFCRVPQSQRRVGPGKIGRAIGWHHLSNATWVVAPRR